MGSYLSLKPFSLKSDDLIAYLKVINLEFNILKIADPKVLMSTERSKLVVRIRSFSVIT